MNKFINIKILFILILLLNACTTVERNVGSTANFELLYGSSAPKQRYIALGAEQVQGGVSYQKEIKPILETRCVACHACYDAPCQLKLGSTAGLDRGATKRLVYDGGRLKAADPTRLFIDASSTQGWREKAFHPVLNERIESNQAALNNSLLAKVIQLKRSNPLPEQGKLSQSFDLSLNRELECPTVPEFEIFKNKHPDWGMPYAMPGLSLKQEYTVMQWLQEGAQFDAEPVFSNSGLKTAKRWEAFFNGTSLKQQLVSRYIFEHLFIGHIHFKGHAANEFYRLVRSATLTGQAIQEIATRRPYDDPKIDKFYYRLRPVTEMIVDKTHFVYELSPAKMQRYQALFLQNNYHVTELPSYQVDIAANPFLAFKDIPSLARYQFMLDDAQYFVSGFIKGPVCRGNIALGVIRDQFWVAFVSPEMITQRISKSKEEDFIRQYEKLLRLPGESGDKLGLFGHKKYDKLATKYLKSHDEFTSQLLDSHGRFTLDDIWDGNGHNRNALLTVFRHTDSATVVQGLVGDTPLTSWIVDYPLFERIHYLLVAGFDVYSSLNHQLAARKYMDFLRMEGEGNFLRLMPMEQRQAMHDSWNKGLSGKLAQYFNKAYYSASYASGVNYITQNPKQEFFVQLEQKLGKAAGKKDFLNQCQQETCVKKSIDPLKESIETQIYKLAKLTGKKLGILPDMSMLRVRRAGESEDLVYTLVVNKSFSSVALLVGEDLLREPELDTLTVVSGFLGAYPNFFFDIEETQLAEFIAVIEQTQSIAEREQFYSQFGIRRTNPKIWESVDWFNEQHKKYRGIQAGLFDLNRYNNL